MSAVVFNDQRDQLLKEVRFAEELKRAKETLLWKWLIASAASEADEAKKDLVLVNPQNVMEITRLQLIAQRCLSLEAWMDVALQKGEQAALDFQVRQIETEGRPFVPD